MSAACARQRSHFSGEPRSRSRAGRRRRDGGSSIAVAADKEFFDEVWDARKGIAEEVHADVQRGGDARAGRGGEGRRLDPEVVGERRCGDEECEEERKTDTTLSCAAVHASTGGENRHADTPTYGGFFV